MSEFFGGAEEQSNLQPVNGNYLEQQAQIKKRYFRRVAIGATVVSAISVGGGFYWHHLQGKANAKIRSSVEQSAREKIANFDHIITGGDQGIIRSVDHRARVVIALTDWSQCTAYYGTNEGALIQDKGHIVDLGDCPAL